MAAEQPPSTFDVAAWLREYAATRRSAATTDDGDGDDGNNGSNGGAVTYSRPRQLTCWTRRSARDGGAHLYGDASGLPRYRAPARLPADLNAGFGDGSYVGKPDGEPSPLEPIVRAAQAAGVDVLRDAAVVTFRNNLNKLLGTPLGDSDWAIDAAAAGPRPTLFLDINKGSGGGAPTYPNAERFTYYGYKFEALCTGGPDAPVDATSEFSAVLAARLGRHELLLAAEVDAAKEEEAAEAADGDEEGDGDEEQQQQQEGREGGEGGEADGEQQQQRQQRQQQRRYVELKTYRVPGHAKAVASLYAEKHPRWWAQSFLGGVPTLVLGGRDHTGALQKVHEVPVQLLPGLSASAGHPWDAQQLLAFGDAVLAWFKDVAAAARGAPVRFTYAHAARRIEAAPVPDGDLPARLRELLPELCRQEGGEQ